MRNLFSHAIAFAAGAIATAIIVTSSAAPEMHRVYHDNGNLAIESPLDGAGRAHGEQRVYWPSGRLKSIQDMFHGAKGRGVLYLDETPDDDTGDGGESATRDSAR